MSPGPPQKCVCLAGWLVCVTDLLGLSPSTRSTTMKLEDVVGPCPERAWSDEWKNLDASLERTRGSADRKVERGWDPEDARAYCALAAGCTTAIAKSLSEKSPRPLPRAQLYQVLPWRSVQSCR